MSIRSKCSTARRGTLFGRNSTGGAILVTLQKPGREFGGDVQLGYGSFNGVTGRASVDMPVSDELRTRLSIFGVTDDGYVQDVTTHQKLNANHNFGVREAVTIAPKALSNLTWDVAVDYERNDAANLLNQPSATGGVDGSNRISYSGYTTQGGALAHFLTGAKAGFGQGAVVTSYGFTSNVKLGLDAGTLNFISGFRGLSQNLGADFPIAALGPLATADAIPTGEFALAQALRSAQYSQEVKWTSQIGDRFKLYCRCILYVRGESHQLWGCTGLKPSLCLPAQ